MKSGVERWILFLLHEVCIQRFRRDDVDDDEKGEKHDPMDIPIQAFHLVIAVGACAISRGPYLDRPEQHGGAASTVPVDLFIPGCPPHPLTILDGLLRLLGRIGEGGERKALVFAR